MTDANRDGGRKLARLRSGFIFHLQLANLPVQNIDLRLAGPTLRRCDSRE
jgi:hypothetical protein